MKTFKEYLAEAVKTYQARIKIAGELPENFDKTSFTIKNFYQVILTNCLKMFSELRELIMKEMFRIRSVFK